jgi:hypothetical protein
MSEGSSSGQENANLYARGVTERLVGKPPEAGPVEVLDVCGEDDLRQNCRSA